ncbi:MAG: hypothetical protein WC851_04045 [Candidatus Shapirobacteria bacterium]|jgi:hypothetical protein
MVSKLDLVIDQIHTDQENEVKANPPLDTAAIFAKAQRNAALARETAQPRLTPEAASTPAVVIEPHEVVPRSDLIRFVQPVTIRGH